MLRDIFRSVGGIENYGVISMIIFVVFFILLVAHVISLKSRDVDGFSRLPLDEVSKESEEIHEI